MQATQGQEFVWTKFPKMTPATSTLGPTIMFGTLITPDIDVILGIGQSDGKITATAASFLPTTLNLRHQMGFDVRETFSTCTAREDAAIFLMNSRCSLRRPLIGADNFKTIMMDHPLPPQSDLMEPWILGIARNFGPAHGHQRKIRSIA